MSRARHFCAGLQFSLSRPRQFMRDRRSDQTCSYSCVAGCRPDLFQWTPACGLTAVQPMGMSTSTWSSDAFSGLAHNMSLVHESSYAWANELNITRNVSSWLQTVFSLSVLRSPRPRPRPSPGPFMPTSCNYSYDCVPSIPVVLVGSNS